MNKPQVIAVFDVGKTNKKLLLFDEKYHVVAEETERFSEIEDEEGFSCEDLQALTRWVEEKFREISSSTAYQLQAVNFSGYGASFVYLDRALQPLTPLYNYLKPYPEALKQQFYATYGGESTLTQQTASPALGSLNSGLQLYRLKHAQPHVYARLKYALHLPQYLSFILSKRVASEITSIGCHTQLWDFQKHQYHRWVKAEGLHSKLPPIYPSDKIGGKAAIGIGLHDSSAALIPYLSISEPFILLSTGTWSISLNPFNSAPLTQDELQNDCLCYLTYQGKPVKASRLLLGYAHEAGVKKLAEHFKKELNYYQSVKYDPDPPKSTYEEAYHQLMQDLMAQQVASIKWVLADTPVKQIFVDGGFSKNELFMQLLAAAFPHLKVYAATVAQASALGAALVLHNHWNQEALPSRLIDLKLASS